MVELMLLLRSKYLYEANTTQTNRIGIKMIRYGLTKFIVLFSYSKLFFYLIL
jgi:hypothetical protein